MINTHRREKLVQAIVFFASHTKLCGKTKLFKLLYLLDFEHFRATGRSVTGLEYYAWEMGPVPVTLYEEWDQGLGKDMQEAIKIEGRQVFDYSRSEVIALREFDDTFFSRREVRLMEELAKKYQNLKSTDMVDVTHAENQAWTRVWDGGKGHNRPINYEMSLENSDRDQVVRGLAREYEHIVRTIGAH